MALVRNLLLTGQRLPSRFPIWLIYRRYCGQADQCIVNIPDEKIGDREIVAYGRNSSYSYFDHPAFPFPAIRFREMTPELLCLREKEKGDWRNLSMKEKKTLYRASFCQTYAEMTTSTGKWKSTIGWALIWMSTGVWLNLLLKWCWNTELPDSYEEDKQMKQLERILTLEIQPMSFCAKWDYKNKRWK